MTPWKKYKLGDVAGLKKNSVNPDSIDSSVYIGLEHIQEAKFLLNELGSSDEVTSTKYKFDSNDILYGKLRPYFKKVYKPKFSGICSTDIYVIRTTNDNLLEQNYLYQIARDQSFTDKAMEGHTGTRMPRADWHGLSNYEISLPPLPEQRRIAEILGSLDDKIELNLEMNKTLEQMAMLLYKRWFVDFEFPDSSGNPYKSNGGEFVESELGLIPKGWEVKKLGDLYKTTSGGTPSRKKPEYYTNGTYYWIKSKELNNTFVIDTEEKINEQGLKNSSAKLIPSYTVLIALYGATVGEMGITSNSSTCNQAVCAIIENEKYPFSFIFLYLRLNKEYILNNAVGSAQQNISQEMLKNLDIIKPSNEILSSFKDIINPIFYQIEKNIKENQTLSEIRDTLLPKLISGEVRVGG